VHIAIAFVWVISYHYFGTTIHIIVPPLSFVVINFIAYQKNLFKWLDNRQSMGTVYYPLSVLILAIITYFYPSFIYIYGIAVFCMGIGDGFAPLVASYVKSPVITNNKTLAGTLTVCLSCLVVILAFNIVFSLDYSIIKLMLVAGVATILELIGKDGLDNLYVPLGVALTVYLIGVI